MTRRSASPRSRCSGTRGTSSCPTSAGRGSASCSTRKVLVIGAGGLGSPIAAVPGRGRHRHARRRRLRRVDMSNLQRQILHTDADVGRPKVESALEHLRAINPTIEIVGHDTLLSARQRRSTIMGPYDVVDRRHRQLPGALPGERRHAVPGQAARVRLDLPVRGPGHRVHAGPGGAVLPLPVPVAAAARHRAELRRGRRVRRAAGGDRRDPGHRGDQADHRRRRAAGRAAAAVRRPAHGLPGSEDPLGRRLPGVRQGPDHHRADRLRAFCGVPAPADRRTDRRPNRHGRDREAPDDPAQARRRRGEGAAPTAPPCPRCSTTSRAATRASRRT